MISTDLQTRYNCGHGTKNIFPDETYISIEPPGTPWAGRAFLRSYRVTGDESLLRMAKETGDALATVQLEVGGWRMMQPLTNEYADTFKPDHIPSAGFYPSPPQADFDDNRTQGPLLFFIELVRDGSDSELHKKALQKGLDMLLEAQYPGGGWPQYFPLTLKSGYSILDNYRRYNHINDGCIPGIMEVLLTAYQIFGNREYFEAVILAADWYQRSQIEPGKWARLYELHTNLPLYCTPDQIITYSDENLRPGYAWKGSWGNKVFEIVKQVSELGRDGILAERNALPDKEKITRLGHIAREALNTLDDRNFWTEIRTDAAKSPLKGYVAAEVYDGRKGDYITTGTFHTRMEQLCSYLEAIQLRR